MIAKSMTQNIYLRWENITRQRYYRIVLKRDLLGDWIVTRIWGSLVSGRGRMTHLPCSSYEEGIQLIQKISKTRLSRGYVSCD